MKENLYFQYKSATCITVGFLLTVMLVLSQSCSSSGKEFERTITEKDTLPMMETLGVTTLISDSGVIKYKIIAEKWDIYDKKDPSYWAFERGVYLEKFDSLFHIDASIKADTAYYYDRKKLWDLRGNVHIQNLQGDKFDTPQLFWDERKERIYSYSPIRIEQADESVICGQNGFESNQQLTEYEILGSSGEFMIKDKDINGTSARAAVPKDSVMINSDSVSDGRPTVIKHKKSR